MSRVLVPTVVNHQRFRNRRRNRHFWIEGAKGVLKDNLKLLTNRFHLVARETNKFVTIKYD
jgi:hypothetical protein